MRPAEGIKNWNYAATPLRVLESILCRESTFSYHNEKLQCQ